MRLCLSGFHKKYLKSKMNRRCMSFKLSKSNKFNEVIFEIWSSSLSHLFLPCMWRRMTLSRRRPRMHRRLLRRLRRRMLIRARIVISVVGGLRIPRRSCCRCRVRIGHRILRFVEHVVRARVGRSGCVELRVIVVAVSRILWIWFVPSHFADFKGSQEKNTFGTRQTNGFSFKCHSKFLKYSLIILGSFQS